MIEAYSSPANSACCGHSGWAAAHLRHGQALQRDQLVSAPLHSVIQATHALVSQKVGDGIGVRGPFGTGWPIEAARGHDVIVVAGGIGLAPLRPVIYHVLLNRKQYGRLTGALRLAQSS